MRDTNVNKPQDFRGGNMSVTAAMYQEAVCAALWREFGAVRHAAKIIARMAGSTPRAAENWLSGECAPQGAALLNLEAQCEAVATEMDRLRAMARGGR